MKVDILKFEGFGATVLCELARKANHPIDELIGYIHQQLRRRRAQVRQSEQWIENAQGKHSTSRPRPYISDFTIQLLLGIDLFHEAIETCPR